MRALGARRYPFVIRGLIVAAALLFSVPASAEIRIRYDPGGLISGHMQQFAAIRDSGQSVVRLTMTLPVTALTGAIVLLLCDIISRTIRYPFEVPVGTVMGVVGGVIFIGLIARTRFRSDG